MVLIWGYGLGGSTVHRFDGGASEKSDVGQNHHQPGQREVTNGPPRAPDPSPLTPQVGVLDSTRAEHRGWIGGGRITATVFLVHSITSTRYHPSGPVIQFPCPVHPLCVASRSIDNLAGVGRQCNNAREGER